MSKKPNPDSAKDPCPDTAEDPSLPDPSTANKQLFLPPIINFDLPVFLFIIGAVILAVVFLIAGGTSNNDTADRFVAPEVTSAEPTPDHDPLPMPTVAEICASLRDHDNTYEGLFRYSGYNTIEIDGQYYTYLHTFPTVEWTPADVAQFYRDYPKYWSPVLSTEESHSEYRSFIWNADYSQRFVADTYNGWLLVDNVPVYPLDPTTISMDPAVITSAYQNREWNGRDVLRSTDFSTTVEISEHYGYLFYSYSVTDYSDTAYADIAYRDYAEQPWWELTPPSYPFTAEHGSSGKHADNSSYARDYATVFVFPDLPLDLQRTLIVVRTAKDLATTDPDHPNYISWRQVDRLYDQIGAQTIRTSEGLKCITTNGVQLWRAGVLRQTWQIPISGDAFIVEIENSGSDTSDTIVYSRDSLYLLYDDGTFDAIATNVVSALYLYDDTIAAFSIDGDQNLIFHSITHPDHQYQHDTIVIASHVVNAVLSKYTDPFYITTDGTTYGIAIDYRTYDNVHDLATCNYESIPIGRSIPLDFCTEAYREYYDTVFKHLYGNDIFSYIGDKWNGTLRYTYND